MDDIFVIIGIVCMTGLVFGVVFGFFAFMRYLRYKETLALAEKWPVHSSYESNGKSTLRWGIAITAIGIALCMGLYPLGWMWTGNEFPLRFGPWMLVGLIPTFFGLALVTIYLVSQSREDGQAAKMEPTVGGEETQAPE